MNLETIRLLILLLGWPILVAGSMYLSLHTYRFYINVGKNVWGKLVLIMVIGWLLTMYSLGIVATAFMLLDITHGVYVVLPIFTLWFLTMIIIIRSVFIWNKEAINVNKYNQHLETLIDERTKELHAEKVRAEGERNKLKVIISSITDGVLAIDLDYKIAMSNAAMEQISGYTLAELIGAAVPEKFTFFENEIQLEPNELCPVRSDGYEGILIKKIK